MSKITAFYWSKGLIFLKYKINRKTGSNYSNDYFEYGFTVVFIIRPLYLSTSFLKMNSGLCIFLEVHASGEH